MAVTGTGNVDMRTVVKIALGIVLGLTVVIVGCSAILGAGVDKAQKNSDRTAITPADYRAVTSSDSRQQVIDRLGKPQSADEIDQTLPKDLRTAVKKGEEDLACIYYGRKGHLASIFQFCFDGNGKCQSKSRF